MQTVVKSTEIAVISLKGSLNATNALETERHLTTALAQNENKFLLVDLQQVESLDSAGLMALVSAFKLAQQLKRRLTFCSVSPSLRIIFELTQLNTLFDISDGIATSFMEGITPN
ncbi:STAS domain-containing protein [Aetokthonos hydrillicola Thurmond2011]|uniref:Anti-sigma factor antagonist n=1 Tax=Aetokthonos hydrillicola Thurmond2011 TaxID=2712845 RepID=A0AAP5M429_9CYAN|nr:STAS domain-containing protein [Aetokthonos hydrillicola]MBO3460612.1 STAS domain-containing protein [Aetokthonos hydrillicola CCALA 1050]MBW4587809.1 STAS domain-containing protein [Aetokthonos hydrillicola CCALA 1050]MDR9894456.1 STAS domain-containing protein [Aetokthonos hydrillicola Thurmond2011]